MSKLGRNNGVTSTCNVNVRSTSPKPIPFEDIDTTALRGKKTRDVYIKVVEAQGTIYTNQTGKFPVKSISGNQYLMIMVKIDSSAVLVEQMSSQKDAEM